MNKVAKPLYTDPEDVKNYENRKRLRRNLITALGGVFGGFSGAVIGGGIGAGSTDLVSRSRGRRELLGALLGFGVGATAGALGGRKLNDLRTGYMESAGLDPTIPHLKARLSMDENGVAAKKAEAGDFTAARRNTMRKTAAVRSQARRATLEKAAEAMRKVGGDHSTGNLLSEIGGFIAPTALAILGRGKVRGLGKAWGMANGVGTLSALIKNTRTGAEQAAYDSQSHVLRNLIPGFGSYNTWKRLGHSLWGEKKAAEAAYAEGFCKAAEIAGVDPEALAKEAALNPGVAFRLVRTALGGRRGSVMGYVK